MKRKLSALILIVLSIFLSDDLFADPMFGKKELITDDWQFILNDSPELPDANQNWLKVDLPHDWSVRGQLSPTLASCTGYLPGGTGWYKKKLKIADELNITPTMQDKAVKSYESVGKWIGDGVNYDVKIMPQGSMNLGTVVRPIDDSDDYDMDLICLLKNGRYLSLYEIKNLVGDRLKEHALYKEKLEPEGKRCWTMQYDEFHMDILPCVPKSGYFVEPHLTAIKLTHKNGSSNYTERFSNPYAYHDWFENRMKDILLVEKRAYAARSQTEISKVPTYKMRTPLQKAIQLLKRHRDICFQADDKDKPISIIITTLAALSYNGESNIYEALCNIMRNMPTFIQCRNGIYWVENPVMPEENFAEKWAIHPSKRTAFVNWLTRAREEIIENPLKLYGINKISQELSLCLGEAPVNRALKVLGEETRLERSAGNLYVNGLSGGLTTQRPENGIGRIKEHTFFGE